ncbi:MAG: hypothetical protein AB7G51_08440 [Steroidobacteraceae bacterium]
MSVFRLGPFAFLSLDGVPDTVRQEVEVIAHPGVDSVSVWRMGKRARPFTCRSRVDCESKAAGFALRKEYSELIATGPHELVWSDQLLVTEQAQVIVLDVRPDEVQELLGSSGGLNPPSLAWLACEWDLILVEV